MNKLSHFKANLKQAKQKLKNYQKQQQEWINAKMPESFCKANQERINDCQQSIQKSERLLQELQKHLNYRSLIIIYCISYSTIVTLFFITKILWIN